MIIGTKENKEKPLNLKNDYTISLIPGIEKGYSILFQSDKKSVEWEFETKERRAEVLDKIYKKIEWL